MLHLQIQQLLCNSWIQATSRACTPEPSRTRTKCHPTPTSAKSHLRIQQLACNSRMQATSRVCMPEPSRTNHPAASAKLHLRIQQLVPGWQLLMAIQVLPPQETGIQLVDASNLKGVYAKAVEDKSSGTRKRKAPPPDTTTGVQLTDASDVKGVYRRRVKGKSSDNITKYKYEPRFTPPREEVDDGTTRRFNRLSLGEYHTHDEAKIVLQIAQFYYDKDQGCVQLDDGPFKFFVPPMNEHERGLAGEEKRKWVTDKAKQVYADLGIQKRNLQQLSLGNGTGARSSYDNDIRVSEVPSVSSASALEVPSCPVPLPPCDVADDYCETLSGFGHMFDELLCPDSTNFLPQQSSLNCEMRYLGFDQILGDSGSLQADGVTQGIQGSIDAHLSPCVDFQQGRDLVGTSGSNFFAKRRDPVLQQLVHRQKQQLEVYALRIVGLEHQLSESQIQNSEMQKEIERLRTRQFSNGNLT